MTEAKPPQPGLRERKRLRTEERLTQIALQLFLDRGFEETTLKDIADAAEIAPRTFFHYFASKEDLLAAWQDKARDEIVAAVADQSMEGGPLAMAEAAVISVIRLRSSEQSVVIARLIDRTPTLRARDQVKSAELERALGAAIAERYGGTIPPLEADLAAVVAIGSVRLAYRRWLEAGARDAVLCHVQHVWDTLHDRILSPDRWRPQPGNPQLS